MTEFLYIGRRMFLFTRPDGTYLVEKPECCRRVLPETEHVNRAKTFSKHKTLSASQRAWNKFKSEKTDNNPAVIESEEVLFDKTEKMMNDVDAFLQKISTSNH